ncbi:uncharacterized protein [Triticum aestivum]|uniref:uncharacterized protein n=1 Tax=Triticum aestivum TaxID=4565 RepID=UPI001D02D07D|nr:uncharacterized protein LOC123180373 [Triticum aestivum]
MTLLGRRHGVELPLLGTPWILCSSRSFFLQHEDKQQQQHQGGQKGPRLRSMAVARRPTGRPCCQRSPASAGPPTTSYSASSCPPASSSATEEGGTKESGLCSSLSSTTKDAGPQPWFFCDYRTNLGAQPPRATDSPDSQEASALVHGVMTCAPMAPS